MSQQINLLQEQRQRVSPLAMAGASVAVAVLLLCGYGAFVTSDLQALQRSSSVGEARLAQTKAALAKVQESRSGPNQAAALQSEVAELRAVAEDQRLLLQEVRGGSLGSSLGYSRYFDALALASVEGAWLTSFAVTQGGKQAAISGKGTGIAPAMVYAKRLNDSFRPLGIQFKSFDVQNEGAGATQPAPGTAAITFRLS